MKEHIADFTAYVVLDHDSLGLPTGHVLALELYRDSVVRPSLTALNKRIEELQGSNDDVDAFELADFEPMYQATIEGYLLTVQAMWERGLRKLLTARAKRLSMKSEYIDSIQKAVWSHDKPTDLHHYFQDLIGISLRSFDSYAHLDLPQLFGNVLRHGDGPAARKLYERCPRLWPMWIAPGTRIEAGPFTISVPTDAPKNPGVENMTLPADVLEHMIQTLCWFWEDIEYLRCNSFRRRDPRVEVQLAKHRQMPALRTEANVWLLGRAGAS